MSFQVLYLQCSEKFFPWSYADLSNHRLLSKEQFTLKVHWPNKVSKLTLIFFQDPPWDVSITSGTGNVGYQTGNYMCNTFCAANMPHVNNNNKNTCSSPFLPFTLSTEAVRSSKCYIGLFKHLVKALSATVTWLPIIFWQKLQKLEIGSIFGYLKTLWLWLN